MLENAKKETNAVGELPRIACIVIDALLVIIVGKVHQDWRTTFCVNLAFIALKALVRLNIDKMSA